MTRTPGFRFDLQRAIQAAGVALRDHGPMDRLRLLKVLYIASRKALQESGKPIIGGRAFAFEHGPLHSEVYDQIKGDADDMQWHEHFQCKGHTVALIKDPGRLDLSAFEIDLINETARWAENFETFALSNETHAFEEWQKNKPASGSARPIYVEDILAALDFSIAEMEETIASQGAYVLLAFAMENHR